MFRITGDAIDARAVEEAVRSDDAGGIVTFLGVVRSRADDGRSVDGLHYEAFAPLTVAEFERIAQEASQRVGGARIAIVHRIGELAVGEVAVAVSASAQHRQAAFDACTYAIDAVKRRAPIWKKERYADGSAQWKVNARDE
jgi:molybdopterin synthase catalytic subunit